MTMGEEAFPRWIDTVRRRDDMSPNDTLLLSRDASGGVVVSICNDDGMHTIEFCTVGAGGGTSPRTFRALCALMVAMDEDNTKGRTP